MQERKQIKKREDNENEAKDEDSGNRRSRVYRFQFYTLYVEEIPGFVNGLNTSGEMALIQGFASWKHRFTDQLSFVAGIHYQQTTLNSEIAIEPRLG